MSFEKLQPAEHSQESWPRKPIDWLRLWFLLREPVGRQVYLVSGVGLMCFKYAVEATVLSLAAGKFYTPLDFVNPLITVREEFLFGSNANLLAIAWIVWTYLFLWIALSMSVRRAIDAGRSPWLGLWVLVPVCNLVIMIVLAWMPSATTANIDSSIEDRPQWESLNNIDSLRSMLAGIAIGALYATAIILLGIYAFDDYGATLFYGTPVVTGAATTYLLNSRCRCGYVLSMLFGMAAVLVACSTLVVFAVEGVICVAMASFIIFPAGLLGGALGKFIADAKRGSQRGLVGCLLVLPVLVGVESRVHHDCEYMVSSSVDIAAPAEVVWQQVIAFEPIEEPLEWYFRLGIAAPMVATIVGQGVGATRECQFTTGSFIEPITVWDAPRRLAFDVSEQPDPMFELTPYRDVHPPHMEGAFRSTRGEFELIPLPNGSTRLVGRTWYRLDIRPQIYWTIWTDWIVHRIHLRVLRHISQSAERTRQATSDPMFLPEATRQIPKLASD